MALSVSYRRVVASEEDGEEPERGEVLGELDLALAEAARDPEEEIEASSDSLSSESGLIDELDDQSIDELMA